MEIVHYHDAKDFLAHAGKYLAKDEARYGLITGIAKVVEGNRYRYGKEEPWFCSVGEWEVIHAAAIRTPPYMVIVALFSGRPEVVAKSLVEAVARKNKIIPGVVGEKALADNFALRWSNEHNVKIIDTMAQRIYKLEKVNDIPLSPGKLRPASQEDKELVKKWAHGFHVDCFGETSAVPESDPTQGIELGWVFIWEDGGSPVSMAVKGRATEKGMAVGGVYTPPELRRKGYATSCVAEVSRNILRSGYRFCTLYTDLANPTSNSIYIKIGYNPVCDSVQHAFEIPEERK